MSRSQNEMRTSERYNFQEKVYFDFIYDFQTEVDFEPVDKERPPVQYTHHGLSRNVSTKGLCFRSDTELSRGAVLAIEVHVPKTDKRIHLQGEVRWNKLALVDNNGTKFFDTGVQVTSIEGQNVKDTIYFDEEYKVYWSDVLDRLLGEYSGGRKGVKDGEPK